MKTTTSRIALLLATILTGGISPGAKLYQLDSGNLKTVEPLTGVEEIVGPTTGQGWSLDFSPEGTLYGLQDLSPNGSRLWQYNLETGEATVVRDVPWLYGGTLAISADGIFYGMGFGGAGSGFLATFEPGTNDDPIVVGTFNLPGGGIFGGMDFDANGTLYGLSQAADALYTIDPGTAATTVVGSLGLDVRGNDLSFTCDADNGLLATAIVDSLNPATGQPYGPSLLQIDTATGAATVVRALTGNVTGSACGGHRLLDLLVDVDPDTLNTNSRGRWITAYITLPSGYAPEDVDPESIKLLRVVGASAGDLEITLPADVENFPPQVGDRDEDDIPDLTVKFDRQALLSMGLLPDDVALTVELTVNGARGTGSDTIRVITRGAP